MLCLVLGALMFLPLGAFLFAPSLLCVESGLRHAEVIVVLGGESVGRAKRALELFTSGAAPAIIVSGDGDNELIEQQLVQAGVPQGVITLESHSRNTKENAEFTTRLLKQRGVQQALIVTSWYHSRRALNSFRAFAPEIRFSSAPSFHRQAWSIETTHVFQEYLKTVYYCFRYGISSWRASSAVAVRASTS